MKDLGNSAAQGRNTGRTSSTERPGVRRLTVGESGAGQRLDNFLIRALKGVPRSHVYRLVRDGQVRVNGRRADVTLRLAAEDEVRIPPVRTAAREAATPPVARPAGLPIVFEDDGLIVVDKPAGVAVHGGSGVSFGVIERLRAERPDAPMLELVHRLDRDTSGLLLVAKKRSVLTRLHAAWGDGSIRKRYLALVKGPVAPGRRTIDAPLRKYVTRDAERRVSVDQAGQAARTVIEPLRTGALASLVSAELQTGRTHQIRVHLAHVGHPLIGDEKYGDFTLNRQMAREGLRRLFLHAAELRIGQPLDLPPRVFRAALPADLAAAAERILALPAAESGASSDAAPRDRG